MIRIDTIWLGTAPMDERAVADGPVYPIKWLKGKPREVAL
jgi:hypothetical protein